MYGDFFLLERPDGAMAKAGRLRLGETMGRDEAWLRDLLFAHPEVLPFGDIDPAYADAQPMCTELQTGSGPVDLAFISPTGHLVLIECKLWRNPEARRTVVGQILNYGASVSAWTYSDLQRQVSLRVRGATNPPFDAARRLSPGLAEDRFIDAVTRNLRKGRFLLMVVGEGIREDVGAMAELINRNAFGFSFGLVEVALYGLSGHDGALAIQPRVVARTQNIERTIFVPNDRMTSPEHPRRPAIEDRPTPTVDIGRTGDGARDWWQPVVSMRFDDPDQVSPRYYHPNNVRAPLPLEGSWMTAYRQGATIGVMLSGTRQGLARANELLAPYMDELASRLPGDLRPITVHNLEGERLASIRGKDEFADDGARRDWLVSALNSYANALRPILKAAEREGR